jgi:hypothetical protein
MTEFEDKITNEIQRLFNLINNYISLNEDWIFYFLSPLTDSETNKELFDFVKDYPDSWKNYASIEVEEIFGSFVRACIIIDDDDNDIPITINRNIFLPNFNEKVINNKKLWNYSFKDAKIKMINEDIAELKKKLEIKEKELEDLNKEEDKNG